MTQLALPRNCPRCRGSMIPERDWYGEYSTCLCCGYVHEAVSTPPIELLEEEENGQRQRRRLTIDRDRARASGERASL